MNLQDRITAFLANAYNPLNLDTAPAKLRQACDLLEEVIESKQLPPVGQRGIVIYRGL